MEKAELDKMFPCLICGKRLEAAAMTGEANADRVIAGYGVWGGIPLSTTGAYGSRILDDSGKIHFVICDVCLLQRRHRILGNDRYDKDLKDGHHNGVELYEKWLKYIEDNGSDGYWDEIKDGFHLVDDKGNP
jgi:transcription elongation factor Elf1